MDKTVGDLATAVSEIGDGATVMIGGFGGAGAPVELIHALIDKGPKGLTVVNNNAGNGRIGIAAMIAAGMVRKLICSFPRAADASAFNERYLAGELELELVPQGTLAERIRAGGAGIPAFYTPTSYGTELAEGKPVADFDGRPYVQERWLKADFALVKAHLGDPYGNLTYNKAARNFSPLMCMAPPRPSCRSRASCRRATSIPSTSSHPASSWTGWSRSPMRDRKRTSSGRSGLQ